MSYHLSKSRFMAGLQCPKRLHLQVHQPDLIDEEMSENMAIFNGNEVGEMARALNPGVLVGYEHGPGQAAKETARLLAGGGEQCIHEATFSHGGVLVRADILERTATGWILTEVKGAAEVKEHYYDDVAIQAWVLKGCGLNLDSARLMHVNNQFVYEGNGNYEGLLVAEDVSVQVDERLASIAARKEELVEMLSRSEPEIQMGPQCHHPFDCEFMAYCSQGGPEYPVSILPYGGKVVEQLKANGIKDVRDIPEGYLTNPKHERVRRVTVSGQPELDAEAAAAIQALDWPRYFLDFETIGLAVPRWQGTRPYEQVPFQWSCHIQLENGKIEHAKFLDTSGHDPRRGFAESLLKVIGEDGPIIAYNAGFEKGRISSLADAFPDLSGRLLALNERMFDPLPSARSHYYHPGMRGSWSLKAVLPTLAPDLGYDELEGVHHGGDAQLAFLKIISPDTGVDEKKKLEAGLLAYCKLDTLAMVRIVEAFARGSP